MLWIISEICYYLGLILAVIAIPALTFTLWMMSLADKADPNFWYLSIAWLFAVLMFMAGVGIKNYIYSTEDRNRD